MSTYIERSFSFPIFLLKSHNHLQTSTYIINLLMIISHPLILSVFLYLAKKKVFNNIYYFLVKHT